MMMIVVLLEATPLDSTRAPSFLAVPCFSCLADVLFDGWFDAAR